MEHRIHPRTTEQRPAFWLAAGLALCLAGQTINGATILDLGDLNLDNGNGFIDDSAQGFSISDSGRAVGISYHSSFPTTTLHAFRSRNGQALNPSVDPGDNLHARVAQLIAGVDTSTALDIAHSGSDPIEIVGEYTTNGIVRPFYYKETSSSYLARAMTLLNQATAGSARTIKQNASGTPSAVGYCVVNGMARACYWSIASTTDYAYDYGGFFPSEHSYATDTDGNRTVGYRGNSTYTAYILDSSIYNLPSPVTNGSSYAYGMCTVGTLTRVVGKAEYASTSYPVLWTYKGNGKVVPQLLTLPSGMSQGVAYAVNDANYIVGSVGSGSPHEQACIWTNYVPVLVKDLPGVSGNNWFPQRAYGISSFGSGSKVVGVGHTSSPSKAFVLSNWYPD